MWTRWWRCALAARQAYLRRRGHLQPALGTVDGGLEEHQPNSTSKLQGIMQSNGEGQDLPHGKAVWPGGARGVVAACHLQVVAAERAR